MHDRTAPDHGVCSNCGGNSLRPLATRVAPEVGLVTSDAGVMTDVTVTRALCNRCACVEVHYSPPDRLRRYFREEYDLSDTIQSNLIVRAGRVMRKHDHIVETLFAQLDSLPRSGRFLEVACGKGHLARRFHALYPEWECFGIDPSVKSAAREGCAPCGVTYIQDTFREEHFRAETFDVVVTHGLLNRSPVLTELLKIRRVCKQGAIISLEVLVLEDSLFTPYVWDHPFMYLTSAFESYLTHTGLRVLSRTDCVSSMHYLCECTASPVDASALHLQHAVVDATLSRYQLHIQWWKEACDTYVRFSSLPAQRQLGLYGAGVYNAVLLDLVGRNAFSFVIDDLRDGPMFHGIPLIDVDSAGELDGAHVIICARPEYVATMAGRLRECGIAYSTLSPPEERALQSSTGCRSVIAPSRGVGSLS